MLSADFQRTLRVSQAIKKGEAFQKGTITYAKKGRLFQGREERKCTGPNWGMRM